LSSLRRILASRANGARSRGPVSAEGKSRVSFNALRHGLLARCVVLRNESPEAFQGLLADYLAHFQPVDNVELGMIEEMLSAFWRQRRAWAIETCTIDTAVAREPAGSDEISRLTAAYTTAPQLALIERYETRLHRIFQRALSNLALMRTFPALGSAPSDDLEDEDSPSTPVNLPRDVQALPLAPSPAPDSDRIPERPEGDILGLPNKPSPISGHPETS
jgi:hypothetical protein